MIKIEEHIEFIKQEFSKAISVAKREMLWYFVEKNAFHIPSNDFVQLQILYKYGTDK